MYSLPNLYLLILSNKLLNLRLINIHNKSINMELNIDDLYIILYPEYIKLENKHNNIISIIRYNHQIKKLSYISNVDFFDDNTFTKNKYGYNYNDIYTIDEINIT